MSRRQSVDRQGILSPPGPFLTPSPSPSIPASPRLQPSPSQSPFSHDVLIVTNNTITNTTQEQERKAATPGRRPSIHQISSGSPNAGTVVFQPSPSQSPAAAQTIVGITGNEFNTTLVGSNNISLNKKSGKRTAQSYVNYGHGGNVTTSGSFTTANMASSPKGSTKKGAAMLQNQMTNPSNSPATSESPIASPSGALKPPTPQPMLQSLPVMNAGNQLLQFIQGPQLITAQTTVTNQQRSQQISSSPAPQSHNASSGGQASSSSSKNSRGHQQILPKPQQTSSNQTPDKTSLTQSKTMSVQQQNNQVSQSSQQQTVVTSTSNQQQGGQILLPTGNLNTQPLLLNQMPVIVQQNTPQGVQLILRPPTPQLAAPSLVIHNTRPQLQQPQPQQLLRILNTNGTMQLTTAPTFIVSSQANLIQQNLQTIKANTQTTPITQLSGLHTNQRSNIAAAFNSHIIGQSVAQLQNLQLNGNLAQIQMPNGLNGPIISQLPAQFQHLPAGFNQLNLNQLNSTNLQQQIAAAAAAAGAAAAFQSPPPPQVSEIQMPSVVSAQNIQFSANGTPMAQPVTITSPAVTPQPQLIQSVTPEPVRNPTPTLQNVISHQGPTTTVLVQPDSAMSSQGAANAAIAMKTTSKISNENASETPSTLIGTTTKPPKKPKPRKKKGQTTAATTIQKTTTTTTTACTIAPITSSTAPAKGNKKETLKQQQQQQQQQLQAQQQASFQAIPQAPQQNVRQELQPNPVTSTGKLDLANVMKLCGIMEDDDYMDTETEPVVLHQQHEEQVKIGLPQQQMNIESQQNISVGPNSSSNNDIMITIPSQNSDIPFTFTIPTSHCDTINQVKPIVTLTGSNADASIVSNADLKTNASIDSQNIVIKIDQIDNVPPYTITIPRDEIQQSIQLAQQQHQQNQQNLTNFAPPTQHQIQQQIQSRPVSVTVSGSSSVSSAGMISSSGMNFGISTAPTFVNSHITLQSQINEIQNQLIGVSSSSAGVVGPIHTSTQPTVHVTPTSMAQQSVVSSAPTPSTSVTTTPSVTTTTAAIKPRRKPAAKRNGKKIDTIPTSVGNVPSQIGNIQISQIDATKINANQSMPISNVVENKIQIMPIIDTTKAAQNQQNPGMQIQQTNQVQPQPMHQQQHHFAPQTNIQANHNEPNKNILDNRNLHISAQSHTGNITLPIIAHQNPSAAAVFPQLTGNLSLTYEDDAGRFILRHDPNLPQDPQSQVILQAILSGALCNVTVVNEPFDKTKALKNNVVLNSSNVAVSSGSGNAQPQQQQSMPPKTNTFPHSQNNKNQAINQQTVLPQMSATFTQPTVSAATAVQSSISNDVPKRLPEPKKPDPPMAMVNATPSILVNPTSPKLVALPKVDANQQLFTLNTITNQITHISPNQTTAALGPMERLLIVPLGINAQQLAECLSQGQIHFNNIGQATQASDSHMQPQNQTHMQQQHAPVSTLHQPQIQQQIVRPQQHQAIQPLQQNPPAKQVANVAPIIDTSKAKAETKPKKAPKPRKPKACADNVTKAIKPIKKLDLSTKPSANPVQIVQPNTASKDLPQQQTAPPHLMRTTSVSNVTTSLSSNIHPFQSTPSGNKLVGVTAPMQQISQQQRNIMNNSQCNTSNSNNNVGSNNNNVINISGGASNQPSVLTSGMNHQMNLSGINPNAIHLPTVTVTPKSQPEIVQTMPPLISVNATPPVPRVQTIQLTPQQQQLLKTVQTQIQQLSSRLQNKNLLANLNIPSDFNPNNPIYNKPLPQLNNIHSMNDNEIHAALQRLFIEQQKILASGKLIPTIPAPSPHAFMTTSASPAPQTVQSPSPSPTQAPNPQPLPYQGKMISNSTTSLHGSTLMQSTHMKTEGQSIPANIVQPNNHNSTLNTNNSNAGNQQRIQIFPMQHQVQLQQQHPFIQQQQQQQQPQLQQITQSNQPDIQAQHVQMQIHNLHTQQQQAPPLQQQHQVETSPVSPQTLNNTPRPLLQSTPIKQSTVQQFIQPQMQIPSPQQSQHQQQQQQHVLMSNPQQQQQQQIQLSSQPIAQTNQQSSSPYMQPVQSEPAIQPTPTPVDNAQKAVSLNPIEMSLTPPPSIPTPQSSDPVTVTIKTEPIVEQPKVCESPVPAASPKPKIPRHCLFERQLKVDQEGCINPDYMTPFQSKEDAVKRLIRYHCMYQQDESTPSDEEDELEKIALNFQDKFKVIANKYQYLLLQESMRLYRTSELCLVNELLVTDAQNELKELREDITNAGNVNSNVYQQNASYSSNTQSTTNNISCNNSNKTIKREPESGVQIPKVIEEAFHQQRPTEYLDQQQRGYSTYTQFPSTQVQQEQNFRSQYNQSQTAFNMQDKLSESTATNSNITIKSEIKSEPRDMFFDKCDNTSINDENLKMGKNRSLLSSNISVGASTTNDSILDNGTSMSNPQTFNSSCTSLAMKDEKDRNIYSNNSLNISTSASSSLKNSHSVKRETDSFDIESEITPSFIMKKMESGTTSASLSASTGTEQEITNNAFSIDYFMSSTNQTTYDATGASSLHISSEHMEIKKKEEDDAKAEQYDEWLCIQKELNFINEKKAEANITNHDQKLSEIFEVASNKAVENHLSDLFNSNSSEESTIDTSNNSSSKDHHNISVPANLHLSEFFNPDSIASKSVETRLEAMFGGSPVVEKNEQDTVESRLEEIFNGPSSPTSVPQHYSLINTNTESKRQWNNTSDLLIPNTTASSTTNTFSKRSCMVSSYLEESHVTSNHPRWIMDQNQFDFMTESPSTTSSDPASSRAKRSWNGDITNSLDHMSENKKMCFNSKVDSDLDHDLLGLGTTESNDAITNELMRHNLAQHTAMNDGNSHLHQNMAHLHNSVLMQMQSSAGVHHMQQQTQSQQQMHDHQPHHSQHHHPHHQQMQTNTSLLSQSSSLFDGTLNASTNHNMSGSSSSTSISSNFDEDINRHVQNAIDSILNLHSSENDSLNFSLEHSMGSFLTDSPLDPSTHHNTSVGGSIIQASSNSAHCTLSSVGKRRHLNRMDDLEDCLIGGAGMGSNVDNSGIMVGSPTSVISAATNNSGNGMTSTAMADFSCVTSIDDAVKSIMTS